MAKLVDDQLWRQTLLEAIEDLNQRLRGFCESEEEKSRL